MRRTLTNLKWDEYRDQCGFQAFSKNPRDAFRAFEMKYFGKAVTWDGYVIRVNLNDDDPMSMAYHSANILIKMEGSDENTGADLGISFSEVNVEKYADIIEGL